MKIYVVTNSLGFFVRAYRNKHEAHALAKAHNGWDWVEADLF